MKEVLATPDQLQHSPSGRFLLHVRETKKDKSTYWSFEILSVSRKSLFKSSDEFDIRHSTLILWDADDRVWVYSGDLGVFIWIRHEDDNWKKVEYSESKLTLRIFL